ncbi:MAG TPA: M48 family metallopeptidase [Anaerolineae bacterium]|mgnify:CR=1 FL=1|nr:M48 family metallopeptidase [Anaerolineae bacterium]
MTQAGRMDKTLPLPPPLAESVPVEVLKAEVTTWAGRIGVAPVRVTVRPMKRKWGSCSHEGRLTFDRDLLCQPAGFRARVIVHELLHLKYPAPHHGKKFQVLVKAYLARYGLAE